MSNFHLCAWIWFIYWNSVVNELFFLQQKSKKIVFFTISAASKLAFLSEEGEADVSDVEMDVMDVDDDDLPTKTDSPVRGYVDFDLIDMDDLGLESIDIPESTWVSKDKLSTDLPSAEESKSEKSTRKSSYSRSMFSNSAPLPTESSSIGTPTSSIFSSVGATSIISSRG